MSKITNDCWIRSGTGCCTHMATVGCQMVKQTTKTQEVKFSVLWPFLSRCSTSAPRVSSRATSLACPPAAASVNAVSWLLSVCASTSIGTDVFPAPPAAFAAVACFPASMQQFGHGVPVLPWVWVPADGRVDRPEHAARSAAFFWAVSVAAFPSIDNFVHNLQDISNNVPPPWQGVDS